MAEPMHRAIPEKKGGLAIRSPLYQKSDSVGERLHRPVWEKMERHRGGTGAKPEPIPVDVMERIAREHNLHEGLTEKQFEMLVDSLRKAKSAGVVKMAINLSEGWKEGKIPP